MSLGKIHLTFYESTKLSPKVPAPLCRPPPPQRHWLIPLAALPPAFVLPVL